VDRVTPGGSRRSVAAVDRPGDGGDGASDDAGVGPIGAVALLVGAAVIIAGLTTVLPAWAIVAGVVVFAVGCAAPLWTFWRRRRRSGDRAGEPR
jgi:membrane protein implicated in regulation of membrane protease activity